ncbi:hypothetical protein JCM10213_001095 [Rhodosporidiobolus nylandii]
MSPADQLVLVSGTTGFLGSEVTLQFLQAGYRVRGTARSQEKADKWEKKHGNFGERLEWAIVKDVAAEGAFDSAIKGVDLVAHTASPFHYNVQDNEKDLLIPALQGTRQILRAAQDEKSVKRVVVTSSFAAVLNMKGDMSEKTLYTEKDWNPVTYDEAKNASGEGSEAFVYCASKKLAEDEAWKIAKEEKTQWKLATVCPPMIFGPPPQVLESLSGLNTSSAAVWGVVDQKEVPPTQFPVWVDVRDIAKIHVKAVTEDIAINKRYLCIAGHYNNETLCKVAREAFPDKASRIPEPKEVPDANAGHFRTDSSLVEKELLGGEGWIPFKKSVTDTLQAIFDQEAQLKK